jgi:hypothetical protein
VPVFPSHGGGNRFHEGIYLGKPVLAMPFWLDCFDFAVRAIDSGVRLALHRPPANEKFASLGLYLDMPQEMQNVVVGLFRILQKREVTDPDPDPLSGPINSGHGSSERGGMAGWIWSIIEIPD